MELLLAGLALTGWVAAAGTVLARSRDRQRLRRELRAVTAELRPGGQPASAPPTVAGAMAGLQRAAGAAMTRLEEAERLAAALGGVLGEIPLGVVVSGADGELLFRNGAADRLLGTRAADALALRAVSELLAEAAAGRTASRPLDLHGPPRRTLSLSAVPLAGGAAVVVVDVSDRRRLDAVRRDFVANVSHELKTPVAALGLLAETLAEEGDTDVVHRLAARMQQEAFRLARIIEDLLDLSRLEAEDTDRHEPLSLHSVIVAAVDRVQPAAALGSVDLQVGDLPTSWSMLGDRRQLVSAISNLLDNAVKYSEPGGEVELDVETDGRTFELAVRDHGIGIPSRDLDRVFERFYRVDRGRSRDTGGTGLGLAIVRHVASNHGGEVVVESVEGEGSCFVLSLPAQAGPVAVVASAG